MRVSFIYVCVMRVYPYMVRVCVRGGVSPVISFLASSLRMLLLDFDNFATAMGR